MTDRAAGARAAGAVLAAALLGGCASMPQVSPVTVDGHAFDTRALLADVPFHPQTDHQCGPASLAMALNAFGADIETDTLTPAVFLPGRRGSVQPEMMAAPRRYGHVSYQAGGSLERVFAEVDAGHPVIVLQNLSLPWIPMWHYAVVVGYDIERGHVVLHSGTRENLVVGLARFDRTWARSGRWAMVVLPPDRLPATARMRGALEAIHDYEAVAGAAAATPAWVAATKRWPEHALAWFARGNAHHASHELFQALDAFATAVALEPRFGAAWINLGLLYSELGEVANAVDALRVASAIDGPWQDAAISALEGLLREPAV